MYNKTLDYVLVGNSGYRNIQDSRSRLRGRSFDSRFNRIAIRDEGKDMAEERNRVLLRGGEPCLAVSATRFDRRNGVSGNFTTGKVCSGSTFCTLQGVPVILSEPHFLHGDPQLLSYAQGLNPDERVHGTYIVIEPYTGTPLSGQKKTQLNLELKKQPVKLLSNVSEGFFPLMWCENVSSSFDIFFPLCFTGS